MNGAGSEHKLQQPFLWHLALNCNGAIATSGNDGIQEAIAIGNLMHQDTRLHLVRCIFLYITDLGKWGNEWHVKQQSVVAQSVRNAIFQMGLFIFNPRLITRSSRFLTPQEMLFLGHHPDPVDSRVLKKEHPLRLKPQPKQPLAELRIKGCDKLK